MQLHKKVEALTELAQSKQGVAVVDIFPGTVYLHRCFIVFVKRNRNRGCNWLTARQLKLVIDTFAGTKTYSCIPPMSFFMLKQLEV